MIDVASMTLERPAHSRSVRSALSLGEQPADRVAAASVVSVEEADPLVRIAARQAAAGLEPLASALGCRLLCVGAHGLERVAACPLLSGGSSEPARRSPTILYSLRDHLSARLHALHGCADHYAVLTIDEPRGCEDARAGRICRCRFELLDGPDRLQAAGLTPREAAILALILARLSDAEIAARLVISRATVRTHCRSILRKLGLNGRQELRNALLPPSGLEQPWLGGR